MADLIVGTTTAGTSANVANYLYMCRFQAIETASDVTEFQVYARTDGEVKVAIYNESTAGEPGSRLAHNDSGQAVTNLTWNVLSVSACNISSGTYYWLAVIDGASVAARNTTGGTSRYRSTTYAGFTWPDPAGAGFSGGSHLESLAVYGDIDVGGTPMAVLIHHHNMNQIFSCNAKSS